MTVHHVFQLTSRSLLPQNPHFHPCSSTVRQDVRTTCPLGQRDTTYITACRRTSRRQTIPNHGSIQPHNPSYASFRNNHDLSAPFHSHRLSRLSFSSEIFDSHWLTLQFHSAKMEKTCVHSLYPRIRFTLFRRDNLFSWWSSKFE